MTVMRYVESPVQLRALAVRKPGRLAHGDGGHYRFSAPTGLDFLSRLRIARVNHITNPVFVKDTTISRTEVHDIFFYRVISIIVIRRYS